MDFSIIICTINRAKLLDKGLYTLANQDYDGNYEIIIIDDGSSDNTKEIVSKYQHDNEIRYIRREKDGYTSPAESRNMGLKLAKYDYCVFTDPEILTPRNMLRAHSVYHRINKDDPVIVCTIPVMLNKDESEKIMSVDIKDCFGRIKIIDSINDKRVHPELSRKDWKDNHFSSFKKDIALLIGGVNEKFDVWGFEGIDFVERMIKFGLSLINFGYVYHLYHDAPRDTKMARIQRKAIDG